MLTKKWSEMWMDISCGQNGHNQERTVIKPVQLLFYCKNRNQVFFSLSLEADLLPQRCAMGKLQTVSTYAPIDKKSGQSVERDLCTKLSMSE